MNPEGNSVAIRPSEKEMCTPLTLLVHVFLASSFRSRVTPTQPVFDQVTPLWIENRLTPVATPAGKVLKTVALRSPVCRGEFRGTPRDRTHHALDDKRSRLSGSVVLEVPQVTRVLVEPQTKRSPPPWKRGQARLMVVCEQGPVAASLWRAEGDLFQSRAPALPEPSGQRRHRRHRRTSAWGAVCDGPGRGPLEHRSTHERRRRPLQHLHG